MIKDDNSSLSMIVRIIVEAIDPDSIIPFGSRGKGSIKGESDYDICITEGRCGRTPISCENPYRSLYRVGVPVDILVETPDLFNVYKNNPHLIYCDITRFGKIIYEKPIHC